MALNLANVLADRGYQSHLCLTRTGGSLAAEIASGVKVLSLNRKGRYDVSAIFRFAAYVREHHIEVLHSHSESLFIAAVVNRLCPRTHLVWHDHYGAYATVERPAWLYRLFSRKVSSVIAVNTPLVHWARDRLRVPADRVYYVPNFVVEGDTFNEVPSLPGERGMRIVCVANLRPQKDHLNLLRAMRNVLCEIPRAHLLLVGGPGEPEYVAEVQRAMQQDGLSGKVTWLGSRTDVRAVLRGCDVGVLSSASEGLPLALLEYGMTGLACVSTDTGQCAEVVDHGAAGMLVPVGDSMALSRALVEMLQNPELRHKLGTRLREHVRMKHGQDQIVSQIESIYHAIRSA